MTTSPTSISQPDAAQTKTVLRYYGTKIGFCVLYTLITYLFTWSCVYAVDPSYIGVNESAIGALAIWGTVAYFALKWLILKSLDYQMSTLHAFFFFAVGCLSAILQASASVIPLSVAMLPLSILLFETVVVEFQQRKEARAADDAAPVEPAPSSD